MRITREQDTMNVADWAIIISICSAVVSLSGFIWNVWSKFIYPKPKVRVSLQFMTMMTPSAGDSRSLTRTENNAISLSATNMGPITVTLYNVVVCKGWNWWRRRPIGVGLLNPLPGFPMYPGQYEYAAGPYAGGLPKKVEVGDQFTTYFVPDHETLAGNDVKFIGYSDTFGRIHWAPKKDLIKARVHIREECDKVGKRY